MFKFGGNQLLQKSVYIYVYMLSRVDVGLAMARCLWLNCNDDIISGSI